MTVAGEQQHQQSVVSGDLVSEEQSLLRRLERHVWRRVVSGFVVLVPLIITILILRLVFLFVDDIFRPSFENTPLDIAGIGVLITLVLLYLVGAFLAGKRIQALQDAVLSRIPIVRSIYGVARQATNALSTPSGHHFNRVVFLEWPRPGFRALGFVTGHLHAPKARGDTLVVVYIPTVPNPTSGNLAWVHEEELVEADLTVEEAMKAIFSGGIVLPEALDHTRAQVSAQLPEDPVSGDDE